jgi:hypothetical protein
MEIVITKDITIIKITPRPWISSQAQIPNSLHTFVM